MADYYEQFAEVYSVSDLHLAEGRFVDTKGTKLLADTLTALTKRAGSLGKDAKAALVVNGDVVDFLSVDPPKHFDPEGAPEKLQRVFRANEAVWSGLDAFSRVGTVVLTLGNHDVELALPSCQALLRRTISGALVLAFDGAGYRCSVGKAAALFLHGNNEDGWNLVNFDLLGRIGAALNAGRVPEAWEPNEGTRLVVEVLNAQKAEHPFLDFLKPESFWLLELLAKLGFGSLAAQLAEMAPRHMAMTRRFRAHQSSLESAYLDSKSVNADATFFDGDDLLRDADIRFRRGERVLEGPLADGTLGVSDFFRSKQVSDEEIRQHILKSLVGDTTFIHRQSDDIYAALGPKVGREVHWVVCGHTHLRRAFQDRSDRGYFNSGTWMRLLDLYDAANDSKESFARVMDALRATQIQQLDAIRWSRAGRQVPLVLRQPTVVILTAKDGERGWLADAEDGPSFKPIKDSELEVRP